MTNLIVPAENPIAEGKSVEKIGRIQKFKKNITITLIHL
jgi:hypothetical protein